MKLFLTFLLGMCLTSAGGSELNKDSTLDEVLDALDQRGKELKSFTADVTLAEFDLVDGTETKRTGTVLYQLKSDGDGRIRVNFDTYQKPEKKPAEQRIRYVLDNGVLIDRNYEKKSQASHQVVRQGEKINLLKLGEGPFPLPIGQSKDDVKKMFTVAKPAPSADDPANTVHLTLTPLPGTRFARKFKSIDAWVDLSQSMPTRIVTVESNDQQKQTDLANLKLNPELKDSDFSLEKIENPDKWNITAGAYEE